MYGGRSYGGMEVWGMEIVWGIWREGGVRARGATNKGFARRPQEFWRLRGVVITVLITAFGM